jgi:alkyl hydroperoxide reductase subunit AhpC
METQRHSDNWLVQQVNGESKRALFVIDEQGIIQWSYLSPDAINPGADGILDALEELSHIKN